MTTHPNSETLYSIVLKLAPGREGRIRATHGHHAHAAFLHTLRQADPALAEAEVAWARSFMDAMRPWAAGAAPPNFMSPDDGAARLRSYYGEDKFRRLVALKDQYDPGNVFALNQNIAPSVTCT